MHLGLLPYNDYGCGWKGRGFVSISWATLTAIFHSNLDLTPNVANILLEFMPSIIKISFTSHEFLNGESYLALSEYFWWLKEQVLFIMLFPLVVFSNTIVNADAISQSCCYNIQSFNKFT